MADLSALKRLLDDASEAMAAVYSPVAIPHEARLAGASLFLRAFAEIESLPRSEIFSTLRHALDLPQVRLVAARILAMFGDRDSLSLLLQAAASSDLSVSEAALRAIRQIRCTDEVVDVLIGEVERSTLPRRREPLLYALLTLRNAAAVPILRRLGKKLQAADRRVCVGLLASRNGEDDLGLLEEMRNDKDAHVSLEAATGMCVRGYREAIEMLIHSTRSRSPAIRERAVFGLGRVSLPEGVSAIVAALDDPSAMVRASALLSAVFLNESPVHPKVAALARDPNRRVSHQAEAVRPEIVGERDLGGPLGQRLFRGRPGRLIDYIQFLSHGTYEWYAVGQLSSATGERNGIELGRDAIFNLAAINRWRDAITVSEPQRAPGAWYFQAK